MSGGQTGVDRAALDLALDLGIACGGWCPKGRLAEDGVIPARYPMTEAASRSYIARTRMNVADSDATLILTDGPPTGGTAKTILFARDLGKPHLVIDLGENPDPAEVCAWLSAVRPTTLNVAGPRESKRPGIRRRARAFLKAVLA
ncbi:MAG: putative molybdenum carrier protein [Alphaproteobacteria bacterium]